MAHGELVVNIGVATGEIGDCCPSFQAVLDCLRRDLARLTNVVGPNRLKARNCFRSGLNNPVADGVRTLSNLRIFLPNRGDEEALVVEVRRHPPPPYRLRSQDKGPRRVTYGSVLIP